MSITPEILLSESRQHVSRKDEVGLRTSINRGYYASYHQALSTSRALTPQLPSPKNRGMHNHLIQHLRLQGETADAISANLALGRILRVKADYELRKTVTAGDALEMLRIAEDIDRLIKQLAE